MEAERLDVVVSEFGIWLVALTIIGGDTRNPSRSLGIDRVAFLQPSRGNEMDQASVLDSFKVDQIRRIALIGRSGSGKTCILAALAMAREAHPDGLSATWIEFPPWIARPAGKWETWPPNSLAYSYAAGADFLDKACTALANQKVPKQTPPTVLRLVFTFTVQLPVPRTVLIEFIDYSGEWVDPNRLREEADTDILKRYQRDSDALLVLAEVPAPGNESELTKDLARLQRAFALLQNEPGGNHRQRIVGLLLNKYDRRIPHGSPAQAPSKADVEGFLHSKPEPYHRALRDSIRSEKVTEETFGLSAFGRSESEEIVDEQNKKVRRERPCQFSPLQSFGLEDPFLWAVQERDIADAEAFAERCSQHKLFVIRRHDGPKSNVAAIKAGRTLLKRLRPSSEEANKVSRGMTRCFSILVQRTVLAASLVICLGLSVDSLIARSESHDAFAALRDPNTNRKKQADALEWMANYAKSPPYRHLFYRLVLSSTDATKARTDWLDQRVDADWKTVLAAEPNVQPKLAQAHLELFESSPYRSQAAKIVETAKLEKLEAEARSLIDSVLRSLKANEQPTQAQFDELGARLDGVSTEARLLNGVRDAYTGAKSLIAGRRTESDIKDLTEKRKAIDNALISHQKRIAESDEANLLHSLQDDVDRISKSPSASFEQKDRAQRLFERVRDRLPLVDLKEKTTQDLLSRDTTSIGRAAQRVVDFKPVPPIADEFKTWRAMFCTDALSKLLDRAEGFASKGDNWETAISVVDPSRGEASKLYPLLDPGQQDRIRGSITKIRLGQDDYLWGRFREAQTPPNLDRYRKAARDGESQPMRAEAEKWRQYFEKKIEVTDFDIQIAEVNVKNGYSGWAMIEVTGDGSKWIETDWSHAPEMNNGYAYKDVARKTLAKKKLEDRVSFHVNIDVFWRTGAKHGNNGTKTFVASPLEMDGKTVVLEGDFSPATEVTFRVVGGIPDKPPLPAWRAPK